MTRAARKLHLAQPALSQAIAQLESELGVELLHRNPRGVTPTEAGEAFLAKARTALEATEDAALTARSFARAASGELRFGFLGLPPFDKAPQLFASFNDAHPQAQLSFHELGFPRGSTAAWLASVDMAMCFSPSPDPEVEVQPLWTEPRVVIACKGHHLAQRAELTLEDVLDETFLGCDPSVEETWAGFWRLDDHRGGRQARVTSDRALSAPSAAGARRARSAYSVPMRCRAWGIGVTVACLALGISASQAAASLPFLGVGQAGGPSGLSQIVDSSGREVLLKGVNADGLA